MCPTCKQRSCAINCYRNDQVYYRSQCDYCIRKGRRIKPAEPQWKTTGYKKKPTCDRCGFKPRVASQTLVYHTDGNMNNVALHNIRTICLNCVEEVKRLDVPWVPNPLQADR
jgi:hypothetical protein